MRKVAQLAGVSTSTVSRVVNDRPNVAADTAAAVHQVMRQLSFSPVRRQAARRQSIRSRTATTIAFLILGTSGKHPAPAFERLLRGVSDAASAGELSLIFAFVADASNPAQLPREVVERRVNGLLLHGERPSPQVQARLQSLPTVWLMANRQRPLWGDQVMPDNTAIGEMAAQYLLRHGHRELAYLGTRAASWSLEIRSLAFAKAAADVGAQAHVLQAVEDRDGDFWHADGLRSAGRLLIDQLAKLNPVPTGLFVAEDRLVHAIDAELAAHGLRPTPGQERIKLISCNNERPHLAGLNSLPATIDIRAESIGRRGVELLLWRLRNPDLPERVRSMVEPALVEPPAFKSIDVSTSRAAGQAGVTQWEPIEDFG